MTGPRRVLIAADYAASGIWWVSMLAAFSGGYRAALASLGSSQQDPPGKLTEFAIRWMEVTNWPSTLPARLSRSRLEKMVGSATGATERRTPLYCWFGPSQPSPIS